MGANLARYDAMVAAIAEAHAVDEVKDIRDRAVMLETYARLAADTEQERKAAEIRLRAEKRAGQMLHEREMAKGACGNPGGRGAPVVRSNHATAQPKTLEQLGITKQQSSNWQRLAQVPDEIFEEELALAESPR